MNRREFLVKTATAAGGASVLLGASNSHAQTATPPGDLEVGSPIHDRWSEPLHNLANLTEADLNRESNHVDPPGIERDEIKERHRIYCLLLMKLVQRFWNGNKLGPIGEYPQRKGQRDLPVGNDFFKIGNSYRYKGDPDISGGGADLGRVGWDRYLGHNIACLAVDGVGEIIDYEFNHNTFFRSTAEHAESRLVRRLFSMTNINDSWKTRRNDKEPIPPNSRSVSLADVTLYTSLESCAQCSGVMSLGGVKQVVFLQHDPGAYRIGNIMYNLARDTDDKTLRQAPLPIPANAISLPYLAKLDEEFKKFAAARRAAKKDNRVEGAFFIPPGYEKGKDEPKPNFDPSITSFLCTDQALKIFSAAAIEFDGMALTFKNGKPASPDKNKDPWTNEECLSHAREFYDYANVEGFRGSPHKL
jgi:tRNA(Arg) A34 adenosine deaminase TadA